MDDTSTRRDWLRTVGGGTAAFAALASGCSEQPKKPSPQQLAAAHLYNQLHEGIRDIYAVARANNKKPVIALAVKEGDRRSLYYQLLLADILTELEKADPRNKTDVFMDVPSAKVDEITGDTKHTDTSTNVAVTTAFAKHKGLSVRGHTQKETEMAQNAVRQMHELTPQAEAGDKEANRKAVELWNNYLAEMRIPHILSSPEREVLLMTEGEHLLHIVQSINDANPSLGVHIVGFNSISKEQPRNTEELTFLHGEENLQLSVPPVAENASVSEVIKAVEEIKEIAQAQAKGRSK